MKTAGKIALTTLGCILITVATVCFWTLPKEAQAATSSSGAFYIPAMSDYTFTDIDDAYAIITDRDTGDMMHASTGVADATWTNCDIAFTKDAQNPYWSGCTIPALNTGKRYAIVIYEDVGGDGSETNADPVRIDASLFEPVHRVTYSDTNPIYRNEVRTR